MSPNTPYTRITQLFPNIMFYFYPLFADRKGATGGRERSTIPRRATSRDSQGDTCPQAAEILITKAAFMFDNKLFCQFVPYTTFCIAKHVFFSIVDSVELKEVKGRKKCWSCAVKMFAFVIVFNNWYWKITFRGLYLFVWVCHLRLRVCVCVYVSACVRVRCVSVRVCVWLVGCVWVI